MTQEITYWACHADNLPPPPSTPQNGPLDCFLGNILAILIQGVCLVGIVYFVTVPQC